MISAAAAAAAVMLFVSSLCISAVSSSALNRKVRAAAASQLYGAENEWMSFSCSRVESASDDFIVMTEKCSSPQVRSVQVLTPDSDFIAQLFGLMSKFIFKAAVKKLVGDPSSFHSFFINKQHRLISAGLMAVNAPDNKTIHLRVKAHEQTDGLCIVCGQMMETKAQYYSVANASIVLLKRPSVHLRVNGQAIQAGARFDAVAVNQSVTINCSAAGQGNVDAVLRFDEKILARSSESVTHSIGSAQLSSSGRYTCSGQSDLPQLQQRQMDVAAVNFTLAVKLAPQFEVNEIVRYTKVGHKEDVQVNIIANPEAKLQCSSSSSNKIQAQRHSYDEMEFTSKHTITFQNVDRIRNETNISCIAENEIGRRQLVIRLTARAPVPRITSQAGTKWWNSYQLQWRHHSDAIVDFYKIKILYLDQAGTLLNETVQQFRPSDKSGPVAMVASSDDKEALVSVRDGLIFGLKPDARHNISIQACNLHGCSDHSQAIGVKTRRQDESSYNNPSRPSYINWDTEADKSAGCRISASAAAAAAAAAAASMAMRILL